MLKLYKHVSPGGLLAIRASCFLCIAVWIVYKTRNIRKMGNDETINLFFASVFHYALTLISYMKYME